MGAAEEMMCVVCVDVTEGHSGDGCVLASTLCKYDLRKGDLFILSWARVRRVRMRVSPSPISEEQRLNRRQPTMQSLTATVRTMPYIAGPQA